MAEKASHFSDGSAFDKGKAELEEKERIEKNDLMHLCMKMNKKIKSMTFKMKGLEGGHEIPLGRKTSTCYDNKSPRTNTYSDTNRIFTCRRHRYSLETLDVDKIDAALRTFVEVQERRRHIY